MWVTTGQCTVSQQGHALPPFIQNAHFLWKYFSVETSFVTCVNDRQSAKVMVLLHSNTEFHRVEGFNPSEGEGIRFEYSTQSKRFLKNMWVSGVTKSETKLLPHTSFPSTLWIISCFYCVMHDPVLGLLTTSERHRKKEEYANNDEFNIIWN